MSGSKPSFLQAARRAGVLLHPTSLPGAELSGAIGEHAFRFIDLLHESSISVWQMLPICPTHDNLSPYQGVSVHAGNPLLISLEKLVEQGWLDAAALDKGHIDTPAKHAMLLQQAAQNFLRCDDAQSLALFKQFCAQHAEWLDDYVLFQVLRQLHQDQPWWEWPADFRDRLGASLATVRQAHAELIDQLKFQQFVFFSQWQALKQYANEKGVLLYGDLPIFVAHDSADVWSHRSLFCLDESGQPEVVAGVPPDYFSDTGQRWGNPHYCWDQMQADGFAWWKLRIRKQLVLFDLVRIDHFRGFEAYWEIPADCKTAIDGRWVKAPGEALFEQLTAAIQPLPIVAEDLGVITDEVNALRDRFHIPGMKILQFAFDGGPQNPYLPHFHLANSVVYTGTHDNDTLVGWWESLEAEQQNYVREYLGFPEQDITWSLIRCALASVAALVVIPMQDWLRLDGQHRMNRPGIEHGNWTWRFQWEQVPGDLSEQVAQMVSLYGRNPSA